MDKSWVTKVKYPMFTGVELDYLCELSPLDLSG